MKCLFLTFSSEQNKGGLFYSTHHRIIHSIPHLSEFKIINIQIYDNWLTILLKFLVGKTYIKKGSRNFNFEGIIYENIWIKRGIFSALSVYPQIDKFRYYKFFHNELNISKIIIKKIIKTLDFDYISAHWGYPNGSIAMKVSKITKKPYFVTYHGSDINTIPNRNRIQKKIMINVIHNASMNFMVSKALIAESRKFIKNASTAVSYNGINKNQIKSKLKKSKRIIFIGNLNDDKRADKLPEIIKKIYSKIKSDICFTIIGDGKYKNKIESELSSLNCKIEILGQLPNKKVMNYLLDSEILILPSRREGLPLVVLEAIACKTIPIVANVGGVSEILEENYLVDDSENFTSDFADRVAQFIDKKEFPSLNINTFIWDKIILDEIEIIKSFINDN
jgi:glycosyltransferase involved in cell wall biosynthesis